MQIARSVYYTDARSRVSAHKCVTHTSPVVRAPRLHIHTMSQQHVQLEQITLRPLRPRNCAPSLDSAKGKASSRGRLRASTSNCSHGLLRRLKGSFGAFTA